MNLAKKERKEGKRRMKREAQESRTKEEGKAGRKEGRKEGRKAGQEGRQERKRGGPKQRGAGTEENLATPSRHAQPVLAHTGLLLLVPSTFFRKV